MKLSYGTAVKAGVLALLAATVAAQAQTVTMYGGPVEFRRHQPYGAGDASASRSRFTESIASADPFTWNRYGTPQVEPISQEAPAASMSATYRPGIRLPRNSCKPRPWPFIPLPPTVTNA